MSSEHPSTDGESENGDRESPPREFGLLYLAKLSLLTFIAVSASERSPSPRRSGRQTPPGHHSPRYSPYPTREDRQSPVASTSTDPQLASLRAEAATLRLQVGVLVRRIAEVATSSPGANTPVSPHHPQDDPRAAYLVRGALHDVSGSERRTPTTPDHVRLQRTAAWIYNNEASNRPPEPEDRQTENGDEEEKEEEEEDSDEAMDEDDDEEEEEERSQSSDG